MTKILTAAKCFRKIVEVLLPLQGNSFSYSIFPFVVRISVWRRTFTGLWATIIAPSASPQTPCFLFLCRNPSLKPVVATFDRLSMSTSKTANKNEVMLSRFFPVASDACRTLSSCTKRPHENPETIFYFSRHIPAA